MAYGVAARNHDARRAVADALVGLNLVDDATAASIAKRLTGWLAKDVAGQLQQHIINEELDPVTLLPCKIRVRDAQ